MRYGMSQQPPKCRECEAEMVRTSETYCCCPQGHGKLEPCPVWWGFRRGIAARERNGPAKLFAAALPRYLRWCKKVAQGRAVRDLRPER